MAVTGTIFDIRQYSIHDGPGIRTAVFFKGCPLRCPWCHNPEGVHSGLELMHWPTRCSRCYACVAACPLKAISGLNGGPPAIDRGLCDLCGKCALACPYEAMQVVGRRLSVAEVVAEAEKDRPFFDQSGGGVTFTGGEPLAQPDFLEALIDALAADGVHTALDTSGHAPAEVFDRVARKVDLVLFDLKHMDSRRHHEFTGVPNTGILRNFRHLASLGTETWVRIPLIPGFNTDEPSVRAFISFLKPFQAVRRVGLLPYHSGGLAKAERVGQAAAFRKFPELTDEEYAAVERAFLSEGFEVTKGG